MPRTLLLSALLLGLAPSTSFAVEPPPEAAPKTKTAKSGAPKGETKLEAEAKKLTLKLCKILMKGDEKGFRRFLHSDLPVRDKMRYWWGASSKGVHFAELYAKCTYDYLHKTSNENKLRVFVKRWVRKVNRYTDPAPVEFRRDPKAHNEWRLYNYSL